MDNSVLPQQTTIIIADAPPLRGIRQRVQQLTSRLAKLVHTGGGQVLYIDEPGNVVTVFISPEKPLGNLWSWIAGPLTGTEPGMRHFIPPAGIPFGYHNRGINAWNHFWYRATLGPGFKRGKGPVILIVCNVLGLGWLGKFGENIAIYDCADEISEFKQASLNREAVLRQENELIKRVDAVVTTSKTLHDSKSRGDGRTELIRNAAEIGHFRKALDPGEPPDDIAGLEKPVVGYYGYLADWLDWPLIKHVVAKGSEFDWVFIGPCTRNLGDLEALGNFHALGRKPYDELPGYLAHFACAHIPFDRTPLTLHVNPVKLYEYLAGGVPVVATSLPELEMFRDVCRITDDPDEYLQAVREAVRQDSVGKRQARSERVKDETWDARTGDYVKLINELLNGI